MVEQTDMSHSFRLLLYLEHLSTYARTLAGLQRDHYELRVREVGPDHVANVLSVAEILAMAGSENGSITT